MPQRKTLATQRSTASSLQRPPVSIATTTSLHRPVVSSGYRISLSVLACRRTAPSTSAACGLASPHVNGQLRAPETWQVLCQHFDFPVVCCADSHIHVSEENIELHASPCLSTYAEDGRCPVLPTVRPLTRISCACLWWSFRLSDLRPSLSDVSTWVLFILEQE